ncbi:hypothetical protein BLNAU_2088 [Blattamonas nauphoetae]|uniref:Uncharacterized protein n=1 Tax=Blattamonas nauphoetae TaxID=2049346 RepID=A0ABQ9YHE1_9EUKA|nr:hypothetical protein BLNAU_2088 [Blattamonas nauphoetae]
MVSIFKPTATWLTRIGALTKEEIRPHSESQSSLSADATKQLMSGALFHSITLTLSFEKQKTEIVNVISRVKIKDRLNEEEHFGVFRILYFCLNALGVVVPSELFSLAAHKDRKSLSQLLLLTHLCSDGEADILLLRLQLVGCGVLEGAVLLSLSDGNIERAISGFHRREIENHTLPEWATREIFGRGRTGGGREMRRGRERGVLRPVDAQKVLDEEKEQSERRRVEMERVRAEQQQQERERRRRQAAEEDERLRREEDAILARVLEESRQEALARERNEQAEAVTTASPNTSNTRARPNEQTQPTLSVQPRVSASFPDRLMEQALAATCSSEGDLAVFLAGLSREDDSTWNAIRSDPKVFAEQLFAFFEKSG